MASIVAAIRSSRATGVLLNVKSEVQATYIDEVQEALESTAYDASKFAAAGLSAATRLEMEDTGVSITTVLPSAVGTELSCGIDLGVLPTVDPEDNAQAIVGSVKSRAGEIAVPTYVGLTPKTIRVIPERRVRLARRLSHDDAAINRVDHGVRRAYLDRVARQNQAAVRSGLAR